MVHFIPIEEFSVLFSQSIAFARSPQLRAETEKFLRTGLVSFR
jgi:hypothetical protein